MVTALVAIAALALTVAVLAGYVQRASWTRTSSRTGRGRAAGRADAGGDRDAGHRRPRARAAEDLVAARPLIESAVSGVIGGGAFGGLFRTSVRDVHRSLVQEDAQTLTLTLADVGLVVSAALEQVRPDLARQIEDSGAVTLLTDEPRRRRRAAVRSRTPSASSPSPPCSSPSRPPRVR